MDILQLQHEIMHVKGHNVVFLEEREKKNVSRTFPTPKQILATSSFVTVWIPICISMLFNLKTKHKIILLLT